MKMFLAAVCIREELEVREMSGLNKFEPVFPMVYCVATKKNHEDNAAKWPKSYKQKRRKKSF